MLQLLPSLKPLFQAWPKFYLPQCGTWLQWCLQEEGRHSSICDRTTGESSCAQTPRPCPEGSIKAVRQFTIAPTTRWGEIGWHLSEWPRWMSSGLDLFPWSAEAQERLLWTRGTNDDSDQLLPQEIGETTRSPEMISPRSKSRLQLQFKWAQKHVETN